MLIYVNNIEQKFKILIYVNFTLINVNITDGQTHKHSKSFFYDIDFYDKFDIKTIE